MKSSSINHYKEAVALQDCTVNAWNYYWKHGNLKFCRMQKVHVPRLHRMLHYSVHFTWYSWIYIIYIILFKITVIPISLIVYCKNPTLATTDLI